MKKLSLVILLLAATFAVFAKSSKKKKVKSNDIISVGVHHTVCFGRCPDYIAEINKDGTATYTARRFTPDTGIFAKKIGKDKAKKIIDQFVLYRVDTCKDMYENRIPDLPGLTIMIKYKKSTKTIYSANFGPGFLKELAAMIDEVGKKPEENDGTWKKTGMPKLD